MEKVKVKELIEKKNVIETEIYKIEKEIKDSNVIILYNEIINLIDGVGKGLVTGDYYARTRYYSGVPGVKNIRRGYSPSQIKVKVASPAGYLLPNRLEVRDTEYFLEFEKSERYSEAVDY